IWGTYENLMIDRTTTRDAAHYTKVFCQAWLDIRKAYDSVQHAWISKALTMHQVPPKIIFAVENLMQSWNTTISINKDLQTRPIKILNGIFQGDPSKKVHCN